MADVQVTSTPSDVPPNTRLLLAGVDLPTGTPVYEDFAASGTVFAATAVPAQRSESNVAGLVVSPVAKGDSVYVQTAGPLALTAAQCLALTGSSALTLGVPYYLSATRGLLTTSAPGGENYVAPVGIATSPTTLLIQLTFPT
jgi:hypothetical protein